MKQPSMVVFCPALLSLLGKLAPAPLVCPGGHSTRKEIQQRCNCSLEQVGFFQTMCECSKYHSGVGQILSSVLLCAIARLGLGQSLDEIQGLCSGSCTPTPVPVFRRGKPESRITSLGIKSVHMWLVSRCCQLVPSPSLQVPGAP